MHPTKLPRSYLLSTVAAVVAAAVMALMVGIVIGRSPDNRAAADSVDSTVATTCTSPIGPVDADIPTTAVDDPDPVAAGSQATIAYTTSYPEVVTDSFVINSAVATWPMPPQLVSVDGVTFSGGDPRFSTSHEVQGDNVVVTFTGDGTTSGRPATPTVHITGTVDAAAAGGTLNWQVFSSFVSNADTFIGNVDSTCTPGDPGQVLNSTAIEAPATTTVAPTTTAPPGTAVPPPTSSPTDPTAPTVPTTAPSAPAPTTPGLPAPVPPLPTPPLPVPQPPVPVPQLPLPPLPVPVPELPVPVPAPGAPSPAPAPTTPPAPPEATTTTTVAPNLSAEVELPGIRAELGIRLF